MIVLTGRGLKVNPIYKDRTHLRVCVRVHVALWVEAVAGISSPGTADLSRAGLVGVMLRLLLCGSQRAQACAEGISLQNARENEGGKCERDSNIHWSKSGKRSAACPTLGVLETGFFLLSALYSEHSMSPLACLLSSKALCNQQYFSTDTSATMQDGNGTSLQPPDLYIPCGTSLTTTLRLQASRSLSVATWLRRALCCICHTPSTWPVLRWPAAAREAAASSPSATEKKRQLCWRIQEAKVGMQLINSIKVDCLH